MVIPRGSFENDTQCAGRMGAQKKCKRTIMPASHDETEHDFRERCARASQPRRWRGPAPRRLGRDPTPPRRSRRLSIQPKCEYVIHPFDEQREHRRSYERRLRAYKEKSGLSFPPGDEKLVTKYLGAVKEHHEEHKQAEAPTAAKLIHELQEDEEKQLAEQQKSAELARQRSAEELAKAQEAEAEAERVAKKLEEMVELNRKAAAEPE